MGTCVEGPRAGAVQDAVPLGWSQSIADPTYVASTTLNINLLRRLRRTIGAKSTRMPAVLLTVLDKSIADTDQIPMLLQLLLNILVASLYTPMT